MTRMVRDLLELSRVGHGGIAVEPLSLAAVVEAAAAQVEGRYLESGAALAVHTPLLGGLGHEGTLIQAVANLLDNAVKYVAPGITPQVRVWSEARDAAVRLWVRDNGIGIAADDRDRVFEPFQRAVDPKLHPGSGVGLSIVRRAMTAMGGRAGVESEPGSGSSFWPELPRPGNAS